MKASYTVAEVAALLEVSRRQAYRLLIERGVVQPRGRRRPHRVPLTRLIEAFGAEIDSIALVQRVRG